MQSRVGEDYVMQGRRGGVRSRTTQTTGKGEADRSNEAMKQRRFQVRMRRSLGAGSCGAGGLIGSALSPSNEATPPAWGATPRITPHGAPRPQSTSAPPSRRTSAEAPTAATPATPATSASSPYSSDTTTIPLPYPLIHM